MIRKVSRLAFVTFVPLAALVMQTTADAAVVSVANSDFESPAATDGAFTLAITNWTVPTSNNEGVFNPSGTGSTQITPANGVNVAFLDPGAGAISQLLSPTITAGTTYTLTVDVGKRKDLGFGGYTLYFFKNTFDYLNPGTTSVASISSLTSPFADGVMGDVTLSFTASVTGGTLGIALGRNPATNTSAGQTDFDNVRVDASPAAPEASSLLIWSVLGLTVGVGAKWRRRKAG